MEKKIDLKSSTIDKGLEIAKDFIDKLIMPSIEETGLLLREQITGLRFRNQIRMLNRAKEYCDKHQVATKKISLKLLTPLLEYSSLEEDDVMQDKWSILLSNLIDSEQNIENHVFPYLLSQLSKDEFFPLEEVYNNCITRRAQLILDLKNFQNEKPEIESKLKDKIADLERQIQDKKETGKNGWNKEIWDLQSEKRTLEREIKILENDEQKLKHAIRRPEVVSESLFKEFQISNLIRLGLIKEVKDFYAESQTLEIPLNTDDGYGYRKDYANVDLDISMDSITELILTELGELFFKSCKEKSKKN